MEEHQETSFYTPKSRGAWRFLDEDLKSELDGYLDEEHRGIARVFELYGIWSHADVGSNFRALLTKLDVDSMSRARIISDLKFAIGKKEPEIPSAFGASLDSLKVEEENKDGWIEIIYDAYYRCLPAGWVHPQRGKSLYEIRRKLSLFNCLYKISYLVHLSRSIFLYSSSASSILKSFILTGIRPPSAIIISLCSSFLSFSPPNIDKSVSNTFLFLCCLFFLPWLWVTTRQTSSR